MYKIKQIEEKDGKYWITFFDNPLYPDGKGGQLGDRGYIDNIPILEVRQKDNEVWAITKEKPQGPECNIKIDMERRKDIAVQHTAQHILSASFVKVGDMPTVSFHMGEEYSTIDLEIPNVSQEIIEKVLELTNKTIRSLLPVNEKFVSYNEAKGLTLRRKLSSKLGEEDTIRLIEIPSFDLAACGGFHVKNTGEIGTVIITQKEKTKGKLVRIYFMAGARADRFTLSLIETTHKLSSLLKVPHEEFPERVEKIIEEVKAQKTELSKMGEEFAKSIEKALPEKIIKDTKIRYYEGPEYITSHLGKIAQDQDILILKSNNKFMIFSKTIPAKEIINKIREEKPNIKGGGGKIQGNFVGDINIENVIEILSKKL